MKPPAFEYAAPESHQEILELLAEYGDDARLLAGGQSLVPLMNMRLLQPRLLIDLSRCDELRRLDADENSIVCRAMVRQIEAEESPLVNQRAPLLSATLPYSGGTANRNRGTVCGSMAHADRLAELPAVAMALEVTFQVASARATRTVAADEFFQGDLTTCLDPIEMLNAVHIPTAPAGARAIFLEVGIRKHGFALVGVAAQIAPANPGFTIQLGAMGINDRPIRLVAVEAALNGSELDEKDVIQARELTFQSISPDSDNAASADYRRRVCGSLVERALRTLAPG